MTEPSPLPPGECVCGRPIPDTSPSEWACQEVCQDAWLHHQANPEYPHPRDIRARAERDLAAARSRAAAALRQQPAAELVADGTEIDVDGRPFVRVGAQWQPAGMWTPLIDELSGLARYRRWCPGCRARTESVIYPATDVQECVTCGHHWDEVLLGQIEFRGEPWPAVRLRLHDGQRSATTTFTTAYVQRSGPDRMQQRMAAGWLKLERQMCGGYADVDEPNDREQQRRLRRLLADWHIHINVSTP